MQKNKFLYIAFVLLIAVVAVAWATPESSAAAKQDLYTFVTFYKANDQASTKMLADVKKIQSKLSSRATFKSVNVADASQKALIQRYGIDRSPVPLTLVLAPNGAVTAGFPNAITKTDFSDVFVSKGEAEVLKALQSQKMAALCLQNSETKHNQESLAAAKGLAADKQYAGKMQVIRVDPADSKEAKLLKKLKINASSGEAQVAVIVPPGKVAATFSGAVSVSTMVAKLNEACGTGSSCGPAG